MRHGRERKKIVKFWMNLVDVPNKKIQCAMTNDGKEIIKK